MVPKKLQNCIFFFFLKRMFGTVGRSAGLGRKAQSRGTLPAALAKATRAGHGNELVILERL